jgi:ATP-dependent RNA helicase SUPV3L1/SUV3
MLYEPSVENALDELEWFRHTHGINSDLQRQLVALPITERIEFVMKQMEDWYFDVRAKERVSLGEPWLWYAKARSMRRTFVFHYGPTNSGKTHRALDALASSKCGVYCAPLKALATQVFFNIQRRGVPCDLLIGDERRFGGAAEHVSCTVEMTPLDLEVDVGVIDEVQLIGDRDRGWAWTRAILGLPAKEIHLCGEERSLSLIKKLLGATGEIKRLKLVEHRRLVPLSLSRALGKLSNVENGDCVVCFSRKAVLDNFVKLKSLPGVVPHVIYGALPFAVRERQSQTFNDGVSSKGLGTSNLNHVLVSTDAIAYGLNMNVRRIIFTTTRKFDGMQVTSLPHATVLQIAGRAGRYGLEFSKEGFATTLHSRDFDFLKRCFTSSLESIPAAGVLPTVDTILLHAELLRRKGRRVDKLCPILSSFTEAANTSALVFLCDMSRSLMRVAEAVDMVEGLLLADKVIFSFVPLSDTSAASTDLLRKYASHHARGEAVPLYLDHMITVVNVDLEWMYRMCEVYCWLGWRFRKTFCFVEVGQRLKETLSKSIGDSLK